MGGKAWAYISDGHMEGSPPVLPEKVPKSDFHLFPIAGAQHNVCFFGVSCNAMLRLIWLSTRGTLPSKAFPGSHVARNLNPLRRVIEC